MTAVTERQRERRNRIIAAIWMWSELFGEPPACDDWVSRPSPRWRAERRRGVWPRTNTVVNTFGSWNAAIAAAGFKPRPQGRQRGTGYGNDVGVNGGNNGNHYCRGCAKFVSHRYATCRYCGQEHDRDDPALEQPIRIRRPRARTIPMRKVRR